MAVYTSEEAHSSVDKAVVALGIGTDNLRKIPTDAEFRMEPGALSAAQLCGYDRKRATKKALAVATEATMERARESGRASVPLRA